MRVKFAYAVSIVTAVAMLTACGKKQDGEAGAGASAASAAAAPASEAIVVKIGHAAPLTGSIAHLGKDNENGARLAVEEINTQGLTIDGHKIQLELDAQDDAADPKTGTAVAEKLVEDHVVAVVGHLNSGVSIPASKIYSDAGIVQISPSSTNPGYTQQGFKTTYRVVATDAQQGPALANYATKVLGAKRIAIVDDSTVYGKGLADEFAKTVQASGAKIVAREATNDRATEFQAVLRKIKRVQPDVIMFGGMDATGGPFTKQAAALGIRAKILGGDGVCTDKVGELAGTAVQNLVCSEAGLALSKMDKGADFEKKYVDRFHTPVQIYAPFTYDAVYVIVDAMKRANSIEAPKVLAAMPSTDYNGVIGHIAFDDKGDLKESAITLYDFKDGKKAVLDVVKM
ncbi:Leucine-, isoleucine-, valine-, threonine-, and alanine-binding protein [Paraburkholderia domus]|uniref:Leucine-, isoleucine-, valine-, threonine-, and alanine-binding protein n=1 Tax=Paraburkholderia domus TaxID=2793075 RepID=A0A9N8MN69_9BURK|nr:branched-chain amino acid ABC transporter substrate-binding protein [Paraburkholderia domus]MBK5047342.1 branched-chain amino acid ABC transporter substrate-binding protein [Burkholderia sp. R-70006]MBK5059201.1 branched-chain amino acid ABC transporter substrate-binding protein [Burkholderia sp. R-70199]MBK5086214.1 branched-chain amino acid ABC transporter substrate-binding protein [Burkholderia sp. R-69927]MBK5119295.1 branched-chain amino acid ABC transporter substrate-binding protein [B